MRDDASTDVVVDMLVFRKRMIGDMVDDETWLETGALTDSDQGNGPLLVNRYLLDHPEQVLRHRTCLMKSGSLYATKTAVRRWPPPDCWRERVESGQAMMGRE